MESSGSRHIVKVGKELTIENTRELKRELTKILDKGINEIELDFSDTQFVDSSGLGKLLLFNEKFKQAGGELRIINVRHPVLEDVFRLINLEKYIAIKYQN